MNLDRLSCAVAQHSSRAVRMFLAVVFSLGLSNSWAEPRPVAVGYLSTGEMEERHFLPVLREKLAAHGWIEGRNLRLIGRRASGHPPEYSEAARELAALNPDLIFACGTPALRAQYAATHAIPIVTTDFSSDPVSEGYAATYRHPGGNVSGVFLDAPQIAGKWFEILQGLVPKLKRVALFWNPDTGNMHMQAAKQVASQLKIQLHVHEVRTWENVEGAFKSFDGRIQALIMLPSPQGFAFSDRLSQKAMKHRLPAISFEKGFTHSGGLASYGPNLYAANSRVFQLAARILTGANPAVLPIEAPDRFDFLINKDTAAKFGIKIPERFLVGAELVDQ